MNPEVVFRRAKAEDLPAIVDLWEVMQLHHTPFDPLYYPLKPREAYLEAIRPHLLKMIEEPDTQFLIAQADGRTIAYLIARMGQKPPIFQEIKTMIIQEVVVVPEYRRQGIMRRLYHEVEAEARRRGVGIVELMVDTADPAEAAYARLGFSQRHVKLIKHL